MQNDKNHRSDRCYEVKYLLVHKNMGIINKNIETISMKPKIVSESLRLFGFSQVSP